jgi:pyruvate-formate lyase-activating enzyme
MACAHLQRAENGIVSFGQGCEGEPLLRADVLEAAVRGIRQQTARGTVHINTNASKPDAVRRLVEAGLNSIRISLNSCQPELYTRYYRPRGYTLDDVLESGRIVSAAGGIVSFNYFVFAGLTDTDPEFAALERAVETAGTHVLQCRNLNIDPDYYLGALGLSTTAAPGFGLTRWFRRIKQRWPQLRFGYFNPPKDGRRFEARMAQR